MNEAPLVWVGIGGLWFCVPLGIDLLFIKSVCGRIGHHLLLALVQAYLLCWNSYCLLKVVWFGGSRTSILTSYWESAGLFRTVVKFSSYSVKPLPRYYSIQTGSKVGTENHNLGNPSHLMTQRIHTPISHNAKSGFLKLFLQGTHQFLDNSVTECIILIPVIGRFSLKSALTFSKIVFQTYIITNVPCCRCDFAMSSSQRESLNLGFLYLQFYAHVCCYISAMAEQNLMKISHRG